MKYYIFATRFCFLVILMCVGACQREDKSYDKQVWAETVATITNVEKIEQDGKTLYGYTLTYDAPESVAVNGEGKPIKGPIHQSGFIEQEPRKWNKARIIYRKDEPIIFKTLDADLLSNSK